MPESRRLYGKSGPAVLQPVEGDVARLVDGSLWVVKGCAHPPGGFVAVPRVVDGKKLKRLADAVEVVKRYYLHYARRVPEIGREVPVVPLEDVLEVRGWLSEGRRPGDPALEELLRAFEALGLECGIAGSHLGGYSEIGSDIDVHCLDRPDAYGRISSLYSSGVLEHLDPNEALLEVVSVSESLDPERHAELIAKRHLQGKYRGRRVTIRVVNCERIRELLGPYADLRSAELVVRVVESDYRTPSILEADVVRSSVSTGQRVYLLTHRLRFAELPVGTLLQIRGTLATRACGGSVLNLDESDVVWILPAGRWSWSPEDGSR